MPSIQRFTVVPKIPDRLRPLLDIGRNLWWCWTPDASELFRSVDPVLWDQSRHNPLQLLGLIGQERIDELTRDLVFLAHMDRMRAELDRYMNFTTWYEQAHAEPLGLKIAYFSAEFGIHECLPIYSGGLGILAGDHLKSASDLGLPLVGVGLCYRVGYLRQYLNRDGWQQETAQENDFYNLPMTLERRADGSPHTITVELPGREVLARIWRVQVGRVPLFLLDTNVTENSAADREITQQLYGGDSEIRLKQEILLGMGGIRALAALGVEPSVYHINEGHSAFLTLERIAQLREKLGLGWQEAREAVHASTVFTTHTPVPAGNDIFTPELMRSYFGSFVNRAGMSMDDLLALGRQDPADANEGFCMTVLALRTAGRANGVSRLHGQVSRRMWLRVWPGVPEHEVPIGYITNGIHTSSWFSSEIARLYDRYLGPRWYEEPTDHRVWERVDRIPDSELWRSQERSRERLVAFSRARLRAQLERRGAHRASIKLANEVLDPEVLTIGFARRFATYKRATLLFRDPERLARIANRPDQPIQFLFAGKAHPKDHLGKELIRDIVHIVNRDEFRRRLVFLEDYDIEMARVLVQGVDVWLNTPRRPLEASGTSGMKVPVNGGINLSVLDGWWAEGFRGDNGWAIGRGEEYEDHAYQDEVESLALYELLESEIAPLFYRRGPDGLPRDWIAMVKASMRTVIPHFNTNRMIEDYCERAYLPASIQWQMLSANQMAEAKKLAAWKQRLQSLWPQVAVTQVEAELTREFMVGEMVPVLARVQLGEVAPEDVVVEAVAGVLNSRGEIVEGTALRLELVERQAPGEVAVFRGLLPCTTSGRHGFSVRVLPFARGLAANPFETRLIRWWGEPAQAFATTTA
jgi:starch phosphorylase